MKVKSPFRHLAVVSLAALVAVALVPDARAVETITVRANARLTGAAGGPADTRYTGFLHSLTPTLPSTTLFEGLKPRNFRTGVVTNINNGVVTGNWDTYNRVVAAGARFEYVMSDYVYVKPAELITWPGSSDGTEPYRGWKADLDNRISAARLAGAVTGRWDIWNEPDWTTFWPYQSDIAGRDRFFETWKIAYNKIRTALPLVKIVGPSIAMVNGASGELNNYPNTGKFITVNSFLGYAKANNVLPDALSVHVFDKDNLGRLNDVRTLMTKKRINLPIAVSEYVAQHEQTRPGVLPHYFAKMRAAGVQYGIHATWEEPAAGGGMMTNAYNDSLDGLLTADTKQPRSTWWVYKRYSEMTGNMVQVDASSTVTGLASVNNPFNVATILLGRDFDDLGSQSAIPIGTPDTVDVQLEGIVSSMSIPSGTRLKIELQRIPDSGYNVAPMPTSSLAYLNALTSPMTVSLPNFGWSDAYYIRVSVA